MRCEANRERLTALIDGDLAAVEAEAVRAHLAQCDACRAEHQALLRLVFTVRALPPVAAPPDFRQKVMSHITTPVPQPEKVSRWRVYWPAAATLLIAAALAIFYPSQKPDTLRVNSGEPISREHMVARADAPGDAKGQPTISAAPGTPATATIQPVPEKTYVVAKAATEEHPPAPTAPPAATDEAPARTLDKAPPTPEKKGDAEVQVAMQTRRRAAEADGVAPAGAEPRTLVAPLPGLKADANDLALRAAADKAVAAAPEAKAMAAAPKVRNGLATQYLNLQVQTADAEKVKATLKEVAQKNKWRVVEAAASNRGATMLSLQMKPEERATLDEELQRVGVTATVMVNSASITTRSATSRKAAKEAAPAPVSPTTVPTPIVYDRLNVTFRFVPVKPPQ